MADSPGPIDPAAVEKIVELEKDLGLPDGIVVGLSGEKDWSFIVKSHAVIEAGLSDLILTALDDDRLAEIVYRLNIGGKTGKLAIAKALNLIDPKVAVFIEKLSELRNTAIHGVKELEINLVAFFSDGRAKQMGLQSALYMIPEVDKPALYTIPKPLIWAHVLSVLMRMKLGSERQRAGKEARLAAAVGKLLSKREDQEPPS